MAERYTTKIKRYFEANDITIPVGFHRHSARRYMIVERANPLKLVARTWLKQEDVVYYSGADCRQNSPSDP